MTKLYVVVVEVEVIAEGYRPQYLTIVDTLGKLSEAYLYKDPEEAEEDLDLLISEYHEVNLREVEIVIVK